jgi:hypothetical protein
MMAKAAKSIKKKYSASYRIDHDLYEKCIEKCHRQSIATKSRVTVSGVIEQLLRDWEHKKFEWEHKK